MFQSINPSISRSKRYQTKSEQKRYKNSLGLWLLGAFSHCTLLNDTHKETGRGAGFTLHFYTAPGVYRYHRSEVVPHPGMSTEAAESSVLGPTITGLTQRGRGKSTAMFREGCQCTESRADHEQGSRPMVVYSVLLLLQCHPEQTGTQSDKCLDLKIKQTDLCIVIKNQNYSPSVKEASTKVIVAKTIIIINHSAARAKSGSLWNCKIHFATEQ